MNKSHDSLMMGSSVRVGVQPMTIEIGDEVQEELLSVPFQLPIAFYRKVPIPGVTVSHKGVIGLDHLQKGEKEQVSTITKVENDR